MITIADLIRYRMRTEGLVTKVAEADLPTEHGPFRIHGFESMIDKTHLALVCGDIGKGDDVLVRVHSKCLTGDVFHSARCDCGSQLEGRAATDRARAAACCCISTRKAGASASPTSCAPTRCRTRVSTRSKPTSAWASRPISATTESARRSSAASGSARCGS